MTYNRSFPVRSPKIKALLSRLRHDQSGNMMLIMGAAIFPLLGMIGGAVDMSRYYMAQYKLQMACDAGALAARRSQANATTLSAADRQEGEKFFDFNFPADSYGATNVTRAYTQSATAGTVVGTTSAVIPVTVMKAFLFTDKTLNVTCNSTLNIPNTDVMFVLDVTGSMNSSVGGVRKIDGLKLAVKEFFVALGPGAPSGAGRVRYGFVPYASGVNVGKIVQAQNASWILGGSGSETWRYQSRSPVTTPQNYIAGYGSESAQVYGTATDTNPNFSGSYANNTSTISGFANSVSNVTLSACQSRAVPAQTRVLINSPSSPSLTSSETVVYVDGSGGSNNTDDAQTQNYNTTQNGTARQFAYGGNGTNSPAGWSKTSGSGSTARGTCRLQFREAGFVRTTPSSTTRPVNWAIRDVFQSWSYGSKNVDVSTLVQTGSMANPTFWAANGVDKTWSAGDQNDEFVSSWSKTAGVRPTSTITWGGCIEEASTVNTITASSALSVPTGANDITIDLIPNSINTKWKPFLPQIQFSNNSPRVVSTSDDELTDASPGSGVWMNDKIWTDNAIATCPRQASRLTQYSSDVNSSTGVSTSFASYVDSLSPAGYTYHDIGMVWGARFLSQSGIFGPQNNDSTGPGGFPISRHLVFMSDGELDTRTFANDAWGITRLDGRVAPTSADRNANQAAHKRRLEIVCNEAKRKGFTIWVIGFGIPSLPTEMAECASDAAHASLASDSAALRTRFQAIAETIGGLRLSQ